MIGHCKNIFNKVYQAAASNYSKNTSVDVNCGEKKTLQKCPIVAKKAPEQSKTWTNDFKEATVKANWKHPSDPVRIITHLFFFHCKTLTRTAVVVFFYTILCQRLTFFPFTSLFNVFNLRAGMFGVFPHKSAEKKIETPFK